MYRYLICLLMLFATAPMLAQQPPHGYIVNGQHHRIGCLCPICTQSTSLPSIPIESTKLAVKSDTDQTPPKVKLSGSPSRAAVIQSIRDNPNLSSETKAAILANLTETPVSDPTPAVQVPATPLDTTTVLPAPTPAPNFSLLTALHNSTKIPAVKAASEVAEPPAAPQPSPFTPIGGAAPPASRKESFLLIPTGAAPANEAAFEVPAADVGVTVGSQIDYTSSWDTHKIVPFGELLQFWVKPIAKKPEKLKSVAYTWLILPKSDFIVWPDTSRVVISTGKTPKTYVVTLTASYVFVDGETVIQRTSQATVLVQVGEGASSQPPAAATPIDSNQSSLAKRATDWTAAIVRSIEYPDAAVKADAQRLAKAFRTIADRIARNEFSDANAIIAATRAENQAALNNTISKWLPWFTQMSEAIRAGYNDGSIRTADQYSAAWLQIAKGLEAAGN